MIVSGALAPGQHLPEGELATALDMSRGPIREALIELDREGLVVLRRHRGAQVISLADEDVEEIYTLRLSLEQLAIKRALPRLTDGHLSTMDDVLEKMRALARTTSRRPRWIWTSRSTMCRAQGDPRHHRGR